MRIILPGVLAYPGFTLADLTDIIYSFCARLYGQRRAKRKTAVIVHELEVKEAQGDADATG